MSMKGPRPMKPLTFPFSGKSHGSGMLERMSPRSLCRSRIFEFEIMLCA